MKALSVLVILFGIFTTGCGGFWIVGYFVGTLPYGFNAMLMPIVSITLGYIIIWLGTNRFKNITGMSLRLQTVFSVLFFLAGMLPIIGAMLLF